MTRGVRRRRGSRACAADRRARASGLLARHSATTGASARPARRGQTHSCGAMSDVQQQTSASYPPDRGAASRGFSCEWCAGAKDIPLGSRVTTPRTQTTCADSRPALRRHPTWRFPPSDPLSRCSAPAGGNRVHRKALCRRYLAMFSQKHASVGLAGPRGAAACTWWRCSDAALC